MSFCHNPNIVCLSFYPYYPLYPHHPCIALSPSVLPYIPITSWYCTCPCLCLSLTVSNCIPLCPHLLSPHVGISLSPPVFLPHPVTACLHMHPPVTSHLPLYNISVSCCLPVSHCHPLTHLAFPWLCLLNQYLPMPPTLLLLNALVSAYLYTHVCLFCFHCSPPTDISYLTATKLCISYSSLQSLRIYYMLVIITNPGSSTLHANKKQT